MLQYRYLCPSPGCNMRKLGSNITTPDQHNSLRQRLQCKEAFVIHQVLLSRNAKFGWLGARGNQDMFGSKNLSCNL